MRCFNQGAFVRVTVSEREVYEFARRWPCFGDRRALSFTFDTRNGDLVDLSGDSGMDESGVLALAEDAQNYAAKRLNIPSLAR
jgi:hypothetical protein